MRLIQNMCTIAEYPSPGSTAADCCLGAAGRRLVKIAVVGASGVGKTGEYKPGIRWVEGREVGDRPTRTGAGRGGHCSGILFPFSPCFHLRGLLGFRARKELWGFDPLAVLGQSGELVSVTGPGVP